MERQESKRIAKISHPSSVPLARKRRGREVVEGGGEGGGRDAAAPLEPRRRGRDCGGGGWSEARSVSFGGAPRGGSIVPLVPRTRRIASAPPFVRAASGIAPPAPRFLGVSRHLERARRRDASSRGGGGGGGGTRRSSSDPW